MGKVASTFVKRPVKNWNMENRAIREIERQEKHKPKMAPRHPSTVEALDDFHKENPSILDAQKLKDDSLNLRLASLVVDPQKLPEVRPAPRHLPEDRSHFEDPEFGYLEPSYIPPGRCSIRQALEFIGNHQIDPGAHSASIIADQYKLDVTQVEQVLRNFKTLNVYLPKAALPSGSKMSTTDSGGEEAFKKFLRSSTSVDLTTNKDVKPT